MMLVRADTETRHYVATAIQNKVVRGHFPKYVADGRPLDAEQVEDFESLLETIRHANITAAMRKSPPK